MIMLEYHFHHGYLFFFINDKTYLQTIVYDKICGLNLKKTSGVILLGTFLFKILIFIAPPPPSN